MASLVPPDPLHPPRGASGQPLSFVSVAKQPRFKPRFPPITINSRCQGTKDGMPAISFSTTEYQAGAKRFATSLVAKFSAGRPSIMEIQTAFQSVWRIEGRATISELWDSRHIIVILDSEKDVTAALACPMRKIGNSLFRLFRWHEEYNPRRESTVTTAWLRLPHLPLSLYDAGFIEAIVSTFGMYLDVDDRTKACLSLKFARVCMELDVTRKIPDAVWINLPNDQGFWQKIELESKLSYCSKCKVHGHEFAKCRKALKRNEGRRGLQENGDPTSMKENAEAKKVMGDSNIPEANQKIEEWQVPKRTARMMYREKQMISTAQDNGSEQQVAEAPQKLIEGEVETGTVIANTSLDLVDEMVNGTITFDEGKGKELVLYQGDLGNEDQRDTIAVGQSDITTPDNLMNHAHNAHDKIGKGKVVKSVSWNDIVIYHEETEQSAMAIQSENYLAITAENDKQVSDIDAVPSILVTILDKEPQSSEAQEEDSSIHNEESDSSIDLSRIMKKPRQKTKGSRFSGRSRPKKKDPNFIW